jgi:hypothetical protein
MRVLNNEELVCVEIFSGSTLPNILDNPEAIMVVAVDRETKKGGASPRESRSNKRGRTL